MRRRAQPWLGTLVEVGAEGPPAALAAAFAAVAEVQRALSRFEPAGDIGRFNALPVGARLAVGPHAEGVLGAAQDLARKSGGAFDVALGSGRWQLEGAHLSKLDAGTALDLGGIAKGYAVDRAVQALRDAGVQAGWVNAGGDLRVFGGAALELQLRDEERGGVRRFGSLRDAAFATSRFGPGCRCMLAGSGGLCHVSVRAPSAMWADALTKLAALGGHEALLRQLGATVWVH